MIIARWIATIIHIPIQQEIHVAIQQSGLIQKGPSAEVTPNLVRRDVAPRDSIARAGDAAKPQRSNVAT